MRTCINECKTGHAVECEETETHKACLPREATHGYLCDTCYVRLRQALQDTTGVIFHLRSVYGVLGSRTSDGSQRVKREPPAPLNLTAYELSEQIYLVLVGQRIPLAARPTTVGAAVNKITDEHLSVYDVTVNSISVVRLFELVKLVNQALKMFPMSEPVRVTAMPCPECDRRTVYTPPQEFGAEMVVSCSVCGFVVPPDKVAFYAYMAEGK